MLDLGGPRNGASTAYWHFGDRDSRNAGGPNASGGGPEEAFLDIRAMERAALEVFLGQA